MDKRKQHHMISVDSETGVYWEDQRALRSQAQINAAICPASMIKKLSVNDCAACVETFFQMAVMKIIRTTAQYFEINSFRAY